MKEFLRTYKYTASSFFFFFLLCLSSFKSSALNYYWVGGTGNWSNLNKWATTSGGSILHNQIPTAVDDVFFDANSFTAPNQTVTLDPTSIFCRSMNWTGVTNTPSLLLPLNTLNIYGSLTFVNGMNVTMNGVVDFEATSLGQTITLAGRSLSTVNFNGIGASWTLQDSFTASEIYLNNGILTTNNKTVNALSFYSNASTTRTLNMGASVFNLDLWAAGFTGFTLNAGTSTINLTGTNSSFVGANLQYYDLNFTDNGANSIAFLNGNNIFRHVLFNANARINGNNTYSNLTFSAGCSYKIASGTNQTINGIFTASGNCRSLINISPTEVNVQATITKTTGVVNLSFLILKDIIASGGAIFTANNAVNLGTNTGWTINSLASNNLYWVGNSGNWNDGNHWSLTSGGPASGCSPSPLNNVIFDVNSFTNTGSIVTINVSKAYCNDMKWTGAIKVPTLAGEDLNLLQIYGTLTFIPAMTMNFAGGVDFEAKALGKTITMAGQSFLNTINFNGIGGGWTLQDTFTTTAPINLNDGTLTTNNQPVNGSEFYSESGRARTLNMGSSVFTFQTWYAQSLNFILNCGTSTINLTSSGSPFFGAGLIYYDLNFTSTSYYAQGIIYNNNNNFHNVFFAGDGIIYESNTYNNLTFSEGHKYTLGNASNQTILASFIANGNCVALINISSSTLNNQALITKSGAAVNLSFIIMQDIKATGGAIFTATNTIDFGNNTGWIINSPTPKNLFWIGNTGNWDDGNHWSLSSGGAASGCSPSPLDNAMFDANSFSLPAQTVNINLPTAYCRDMTWTGVTNLPTLAGPNFNKLKIYGSVVFSVNMNQTFQGVVDFEAKTPDKTIAMSGKSFLDKVNFVGVGGGWTLQDTFSTTKEITLFNGTLNTNNQVINASSFLSQNNAIKKLIMGSSVFNLSDSWTVLASPNFILNSGTSVINFNSSNGNFSGGNFAYYDLNFNSSFSTGNINDNNSFRNVLFNSNGNINQSNTFNELTFTSGFNYTLKSGSTQTINNRWQVQGSCVSYILLKSSLQGTVATVTKPLGAVLGYNIHIKDIKCTGAANFIAYNSVDLGGNTGWNFTSLVPLLPPNAIAGQSQICAGASSVVYRTSPVAGAIYYLWTVPAGASITSGQGDTTIKVNFGASAGGNITLKSFNGCNYSNAISTFPVSITAQLLSTVSLLANPSGSICPGIPVVFTANATNITNSTVTYHFKVNGLTVQNTTSNIYTNAVPINGDLVVCEIAVNRVGCFGTAMATSNTIAIQISSSSTLPTVVLSSNQTGGSCNGTSIIFTAIAANTGSGIVSYNFKVNGLSVQNTNSNIYSSASLTSGSIVTCEIFITGSNCILSNNALSNPITVLSNPASNVSLAPFLNICKTAAAFTITGGLPIPTTNTTGIYLVDNIVQTVFTAANYTAGVHSITYVYTNSFGCTNTASQNITILPTPTVELQFSPSIGLSPSMPMTIIAKVTPLGNYTFTWSKNNVLLPTQINDRITILANEAGNYSVTVTDAITGCVASSSSIYTQSAIIKDSIFILPNPSNGIFNVSYNNGAANLGGRVINVYDGKGARIFTNRYFLNVPYGNMKVDISQHPSEVYFLALFDSKGKLLASAKIRKL